MPRQVWQPGPALFRLGSAHTRGGQQAVGWEIGWVWNRVLPPPHKITIDRDVDIRCDGHLACFARNATGIIYKNRGHANRSAHFQVKVSVTRRNKKLAKHNREKKIHIKNPCCRGLHGGRHGNGDNYVNNRKSLKLDTLGHEEAVINEKSKVVTRRYTHRVFACVTFLAFRGHQKGCRYALPIISTLWPTLVNTNCFAIATSAVHFVHFSFK